MCSWELFKFKAFRSKNRNKSQIRSRVEHVFAAAKHLRGFGKVRYRGCKRMREYGTGIYCSSTVQYRFNLNHASLVAEIRP